MPKQTVDVLMGGYLSKDAAHEDFEAVQACGAPLLGLVVVSKALDGSMEIEQHDHIVKEGAMALGGSLRAASPCRNRGRGGRRSGRRQDRPAEGRECARGPSPGDHPDRRCRADRGLRPRARGSHRGRGHAGHQEGRWRGDRQPREGCQGRSRRRVGEDERPRGLTAGESMGGDRRRAHNSPMAAAPDAWAGASDCRGGEWRDVSSQQKRVMIGLHYRRGCSP
jgi:hypothetical protein